MKRLKNILAAGALLFAACCKDTTETLQFLLNWKELARIYQYQHPYRHENAILGTFTEPYK